jgi:DNA-binding CsgD family transcriptional regulator
LGELTPREREVLWLVSRGYTVPETAEALDMSTGTVRTHRMNIMRRLGAHSIAHAVAIAMREGLIPMDGWR